MTRLFVLIISIVLSLPAAPAPALAADHPEPPVQLALPAQEGEPGSRMGREPWIGTNWGLVAAFSFGAIVLATVVVIVSVILSWPHRSR